VAAQLRHRLFLLQAAREAFDAPEKASQEPPVQMTVLRDADATGRESIIYNKPELKEMLTLTRGIWRRTLGSWGGASDDEQIEWEEPCQEGERVRRVRIWSGMLVYSVCFELSSGRTTRSFSSSSMWAGREQEPFVLEPGEFLVLVRGRQGVCLDAVSFVTNRGRESAWSGNATGGSPFEIKASPWCQLWGLERDVFGKVTGVVEHPAPEEYMLSAAGLGGGWWGLGTRAPQTAQAPLPVKRPRWQEVRGSIPEWLAIESKHGQLVQPRVLDTANTSLNNYLQRTLKYRRSSERRWSV